MRRLRIKVQGRVAAAFVVTIAIGSPACAGGSGQVVDLGSRLPRSAETGKPMRPPFIDRLARQPGPCLYPLPCGARLIGAIHKNGAVELTVPALHW